MKDSIKPMFEVIQPSSSNIDATAYRSLSRRQFLVTSSLLVTSSSLIILPPSLDAKEEEANFPYGSDPTTIGFNGEYQDPVTGMYLLGNGYRAYNPRLLSFNAADSMSPFNNGGINPYCYCEGDPRNFIDPTGNMRWQTAVGIGLGILGFLISIITLGKASKAGIALIGAGASIAQKASAGLSVGSAALGVTSSATGIASKALASSDKQLSDKLGVVSLGLGIGSALTGLSASSITSFSQSITPSNSVTLTSMTNITAGVSTTNQHLSNIRTTRETVEDGEPFYRSNEEFFLGSHDDNVRKQQSYNYTLQYSNDEIAHSKTIHSARVTNGKQFHLTDSRKKLTNRILNLSKGKIKERDAEFIAFVEGGGRT